MKRSIFFKIFGGYVLIVVALSTLILLFSLRTIRDYHVSTVTQSLVKLGITLSRDVTPFLEEKRMKELDAFAKALGSQIKTRITVIDPEGVVVADSEKDPATMESHKNRPEIIQAFRGRIGTFSRYSTTAKESMLYVAIPIKKNEKMVGVLRISIFLKDINSLLGNLKANILEILLVIVFISIFGAFIFSRSITRPIRELSTAFRKVTSGDFGVKVFFKNRDEVKDLGDSFNMMTDQIKTLFGELARQKESLNSIISSLQAGLAVLDSKERIILSNDSFKKIVHHESVAGKFCWEYIREVKFGELLKKVRAEKRNLGEEITLNERAYLCSATFMEAQDEIVLIFHDITTLKNVERIKKDFVVNVSHELRTPLTAIKGFAETLEEMVGEEGCQYVEIIQKNTDRLINIVQDLLLLSELEEKGGKLAVEEVRVQKVMENVIRIFKQQLGEKNLELKLNIENNLPPIKGDPFKLEQMFINLLDNAIKYTEKGSISFSLSQSEEEIKIVIQDTGIGIPKEHLSRIFERFYVVDKSRSKKLGGTGLGLSIVKHIVSLHKGTIEAESVYGVGTKFIITLPINPA